MGALRDRVDSSMKIFGGNIVDYYRENVRFMVDKYSKDSDDCKSISPFDLWEGGFYFFQYMDDSNWMRYSPVFCADHRKMNQLTVLLCVNFNFIPLEVRSALFDKFISEKNFENNDLLKVNFQGMYTELLKYGFEYSVVEYNLSQIKVAHRISLDLLPRFLYSSHPKNKYDPYKLLQIWNKKLETREKRHQEMISSVLADFYNLNSDISEKYDALQGHIQRLQRNFEKFG